MYKYASIFLFAVLFSVVLPSGELRAQVSFGGIPPGLNVAFSLKSSGSVREINADFDVNEWRAEDAGNESQGLPLRVSKIIPVDLNMENSGRRISLPDGREIWQLRLKAPGATACMLYYDEFYIPEGGKLFIYNATGTHILGAYTTETNVSGGMFATEFLKGEDIIVEYVYPVEKNPVETARIRITGLGYGYNHLDLFDEHELMSVSDGCEVNINCPEGRSWQHQKKGVAKTITRIGNSNYLCSGSLVNNTSGSVIPYYLSANHCFYSRMTQATFNTMVFYFHYEYPDCENLVLDPASKTMIGAERLVTIDLTGGSDGALLKLLSDVPESYDVFYNGWNANNITPASGVCIHHPEGDVKKISTYTSRATSTTWRSTDGVGATNAHLSVVFAKTENGHGVTEGGSSGSPLFDQNGRIAGTLTGGNSSCELPSGSNLFGKFWYHWGQSDTAKMRTYLDPQQTGTTILDGRYTDPLHIDFSAEDTTVYAGSSVSFENRSYGYTSLEWSFPGGVPSTSTSENPTVQFMNPGVYNVSLTIYNGSEMRTKTISVNVDYRTGWIIPESLTVTAWQDRSVLLSWDAYGSVMIPSALGGLEVVPARDCSFSIFRDERLIASGLKSYTYYIDEDVPENEGIYCYRVTAVFDDDNDESGSSDSECIYLRAAGIEDQQASYIKIGPNPVNDALVIESEQERVERLIIADVNGRIRIDTRPLSNTFTVSTPGWPTGIYFVKVITDSGSSVHKVIKK